MANRNQKRIKDAAREEIVNKRRNDGKNVNPPRKNNPKNFDKYTTFPGFRKPTREEKNLVRVYKEQ